MIVEFIGSTGAGKSTLIAAVQAQLAQSAQVATAFEVVATPLGLQRTTNPTAQNLIQEIAGLPFFVGALPRYKVFLAYITKMLFRHGKFNFHTLNYLRSLERTIAVYEMLRRAPDERIMLVDEGTIVPAHNAFVYTAARYTPEEITQFANLAPLPDLVIYIKAPVESLIQRALQRSDPPREMRSRNPAVVENYVRRAAAMFEQLVSAEKLRNRVLVVENRNATAQERNLTAESITRFILTYATADRRAPHLLAAER